MSAQHVLAAALVQPGKYELREYPLPEAAPGCVLVKMELSGICGTDKHTYQGFTTQYAGTGDGKQIRFPVIQGHENVGTVAAIGGSGRYTDFEGLPARFPLLLLPEHDRLRQQSKRCRSTPSFWGMVAIHVHHSGKFSG
jgi:threonine dehydrogenase-like Zn-dependent dehydrogenase